MGGTLPCARRCHNHQPSAQPHLLTPRSVALRTTYWADHLPHAARGHVRGAQLGPAAARKSPSTLRSAKAMLNNCSAFPIPAFTAGVTTTHRQCDSERQGVL